MSLNNTSNITEELTTNMDLNSITNFISYANRIKEVGLGDYSSDVSIAMEAVKLLTQGAIYAFKVNDTYSERVGGNSQGVHLYRRIGENDCIPIFSWENISGGNTSVPTEQEAIQFLIENKINAIITGPIIFEFLGIASHYTDDDGEEEKTGILDPSTIENMRNNGINVSVVERLI